MKDIKFRFVYGHDIDGKYVDLYHGKLILGEFANSADAKKYIVGNLDGIKRRIGMK